ncbi:MAG: phosphate ABC transporter substrate-binding protein [Deltaproteobacteria bacterium]|nr:phosphate ABC transporter substrate-binding protein [Deltaproteobacteria bacterium]
MSSRRSPRRLPVLLACASLLLGLAGCGKRSDSAAGAVAVIQNKGSDTMVNLAQAWAEAYKKAAPSVEVEVSGGGSGVGIAALIKGAVDLANASRNMKPKEIEEAKKNNGKVPKEFVVGYDALAIFVHKDNPLNEITMNQLAQIYAEGGRITKWSELGVRLPSGRDEIIRVSRQSSSGTYEFLRERVLKKKDFKLGSLDLNGSKEVVELVANTPGAIAYSGMGYATRGIKMLGVAPKPGAPAVPPTVETTLDRSYPIARSLQMYTLGEPEGAVKEYLSWILSEPGQKIVEESGYVPSRPVARKK